MAVGQTFCFLLDRVELFLVDLKVHRYGRRFDGNASLLFILSCICIPGFTGLGTGNDASFRDERVGECRFSVVDWDDALVCKR
jgi:hypothetical protein